jgi:hypothetical protein
MTTWVRTAGHQTYHAVFAEGDRTHFYCDKAVFALEIEHTTTDQPRNRCPNCVRRLAHPELIPERMREMLREDETPAPNVKPCASHCGRRLHKTLHRYFDGLVACYLRSNPQRLPGNTTVLQLMEWSYEQTKGPDEEGGEA